MQKSSPEFPVLDRYIPFDWLFRWDAGPLKKYCTFLLIFIPLIYGFLGIQDPFNIINYTIIIPFYFIYGSQIIRSIATGIYKLKSESQVNNNNDNIIFKSTFTKYLRPSQFILLLSVISIIFQLLYIYNELGAGPEEPTYFNYRYLTGQQWIITSFPIIFFVLYILVQFFCLWFGLVFIIALFDLTWTAISTSNQYAKSKGLTVAKLKEIFRFKESIKGCLKIVALLIFNSVTYSVNIHQESSFNLLSFDFVAIVITIMAFALSYRLESIFMKHMADETVNKTSSFIPGLKKFRGTIKKWKVVYIVSFSSYIPIISTIAKYLSEDIRQQILKYFSSALPYFCSYLNFNRFNI